MNIRISLFIAILTLTFDTLQAQVPKTIMVEHFTNTRCGICGSRNPSFISYLNTRTDVLHMSVHPSRPYSTCELNKHNTTENDDRTKFYSGVFGSTPRIVLSGQVIAANVNYASMSTYAPYTAQMSPVSISIDPIEYAQATDSLTFRVVLHTESTHSLGNLSLFLAVTEDTVFYNAPNGESRHYNVFRKSATAVTGDPAMAASMVGDSTVYVYRMKYNADWDFKRINATVIVQETATKEVVQATRQTEMNETNQGPNSVNSINAPMQPISVYPNPLAGEVLHLQHTTKVQSMELYNLNGDQVASKVGHADEWVLEDLMPGAYVLRIQDEEHGIHTQLLFKQ